MPDNLARILMFGGVGMMPGFIVMIAGSFFNLRWVQIVGAVLLVLGPLVALSVAPL